MSQQTEDLPFLDDLGEEFSRRPHEMLRSLRDKNWIARCPQGLTVLGFKQVQELFREPRLLEPHIPLVKQKGITSGKMFEAIGMSFATMDGPDHDRLRRIVNRAFTARGVDRLRDFIVATSERLVADFADRGHCEFVNEYAKPLPTRVICRLLGVPDADAPLFQEWADEENKLMEFHPDRGPDPHVWELMYDYVSALVDTRKKSPADDLITALIVAEDEGDRLSHDELIWTVNLVLVGGEDTTRCQIALGMNAFLQHPAQWRMLVERPDLVDSATDEIVRYAPALMAMPRIVGESFEHDGVYFPAGTALFLSIASANRDPSIYEDPELFDITRKSTVAPVTFGSGAHYCLGAMLAKVEVRESLRVLARRIRDPLLDGKPTFRPPAGVTGPSALPMKFTAAA